MRFTFTVHDEFASIEASKQKHIFTQGLISKGTFLIPKNFFQKISCNSTRHLWKKHLRQVKGNMNCKESEIEINSINTIDDINNALKNTKVDLLLLEEETARICFDSHDADIHQYEGKEACIASHYAIEQTHAYKNISKLWESQELSDGELIWHERLKPLLNSAKKLIIADRHLASYLYGSQFNTTKIDLKKKLVNKQKKVKQLISRFAELSSLKELNLVCEKREKDFLGEVKAKDLPVRLNVLKNLLESTGLIVNIYLGPVALFTKHFKESRLYVDEEFFIMVGHLGDLLSEPDRVRVVAVGQMSASNDKAQAYKKIGKPYNGQSWEVI